MKNEILFVATMLFALIILGCTSGTLSSEYSLNVSEQDIEDAKSSAEALYASPFSTYEDDLISIQYPSWIPRNLTSISPLGIQKLINVVNGESSFYVSTVDKNSELKFITSPEDYVDVLIKSGSSRQGSPDYVKSIVVRNQSVTENGYTTVNDIEWYKSCMDQRVGDSIEIQCMAAVDCGDFVVGVNLVVPKAYGLNEEFFTKILDSFECKEGV